jgi:hypothetical protein
VQQVTIPPQARHTINVETVDPHYWDSEGVVRAGGTNVTATRLQPDPLPPDIP